MKEVFSFAGIFFLLALFSKNSCAQLPGMVSITSKPAGADVYLQGENTGQKTPYQKPLSPGIYSYSLKLEGFQDFEGEFELGESEIEAIEVELKPEGSIVKIDSDPPGADIFIDGDKIGKTPLALDDLEPGDHDIKVVLDSYPELNENFSNRNGEITELNYSLSKNLSILGILAYPDAEIFLDGEKVGTRSFSGHVDEGEHLIEVEREGYISQWKKINVTGGEDVTQRFELQKIKGGVVIASAPDSAEVFINGDLKGKTPLEIDDLEYGEYSLKILQEGFSPYLETIHVGSGEKIRINAELKSGQPVTIQSSPSGAIVKVDGEEKGKTPLDIALKKGEHILKFTRMGYVDKEITLNVRNGETVRVDLDQEKLTLNVATNPKGAKVMMGNELIGFTPLKEKIPLGIYRINVSKKGYKPITEELSAFENTLDLSYDLEYDKVRKKSTAILYSVLFPGGGQAYLTRRKIPLLLGVAAFGGIGGYFYFDQNAKSSYQEYLDETSDISRRFQLQEDFQNAAEYSDYCIYGALGIYVLNLVWVASMPDDTQRMENIDLSLNVHPVHAYPEVGVRIRF